MPVFNKPAKESEIKKATVGAVGDIMYIPLGNIKPNPNQPRKDFDEEHIRELAASIEKNGLLQPIIVRKKSPITFEIVAGERRWRAANLAGVYEIPAILKDFDDRQAFEIGLIENLQRKNLSPIEEANGYKKLMLDFNYTQEDIAKMINKSRSYIGNILRLLSLPAKVRDLVANGDISYTIARTLVGSEDPLAEARAIVKKELNAREVEKTSSNKKPKPDEDDSLWTELISIKENLQKSLNAEVDIELKKNKGKIIIKFGDMIEFDNIITKLNNL
jgi:ParB family chromosome partitioning protein